MFLTGVGLSSAMRALLFVGLFGHGAACTPDLGRQAGSLRLDMTQIRADVQSVRLQVEVADVGAQQDFVLPASAPQMSHRIDSLPAGQVRVLALGEKDGQVLVHGLAVGLVRQDQETNMRIVMGQVTAPIQILPPVFDHRTATAPALPAPERR